jgi:hypothetical protein
MLNEVIAKVRQLAGLVRQCLAVDRQMAKSRPVRGDVINVTDKNLGMAS